MKIIVEKNYDSLSKKAAQLSAGFIRKKPDGLFCFAAGNTPMGMFLNLINLQRQSDLDLSSVYYASLDEWIGLGKDDVGSCKQMMHDYFYSPAKIPDDRIHVFDGLDQDTGSQCIKMEAWIKMHGGVDLAVLGIGMNGHIGFNEPNTPEKEGCIVVPLDHTTKSVSAKYFGKALPVTHGITIGWSTLKMSSRIILLANGKQKAEIVKASLNGPITDSVPASKLQDHDELTVILDEEAASLL